MEHNIERGKNTTANKKVSRMGEIAHTADKSFSHAIAPLNGKAGNNRSVSIYVIILTQGTSLECTLENCSNNIVTLHPCQVGRGTVYFERVEHIT